jgi:hypothetical protein
MTGHQLMMLGKLKREEEVQNRSELEDIVVDYKLGLLDPTRTILEYERSQRIKLKR